MLKEDKDEAELLQNKCVSPVTVGVSIKISKNKTKTPTQRLAASEKSYLLASFFKKTEQNLDQELDLSHGSSNDNNSDLIVNRIKIRKKILKEALSEYSPSTSVGTNDFAIVSKEEIEKF